MQIREGKGSLIAEKSDIGDDSHRLISESSVAWYLDAKILFRAAPWLCLETRDIMRLLSATFAVATKRKNQANTPIYDADAFLSMMHPYGDEFTRNKSR